MSDDISGTYNFVTGDFQNRLPTNDEEAMQCLPGETERALYDLYCKMGDPLLVAYERVLKKIAEIYEAVHGVKTNDQ